MTFRRFEDIEDWQLARELTRQVYGVAMRGERFWTAGADYSGVRLDDEQHCRRVRWREQCLVRQVFALLATFVLGGSKSALHRSRPGLDFAG